MNGSLGSCTYTDFCQKTALLHHYLCSTHPKVSYIILAYVHRLTAQLLLIMYDL